MSLPPLRVWPGYSLCAADGRRVRGAAVPRGFRAAAAPARPLRLAAPRALPRRLAGTFQLQLPEDT